jgi:hypothetical protein
MPVAEQPALRSPGVTLLACLLIATPLIQWAYVSALSYFTILEPPLTASRGIPLAIQLFFTPGNVVPVALGVGLLFRSEWTRRVARGVFVVAVAFGAWLLGTQVARAQLDSNALLSMLSLAICGVSLWYFGLPRVRAEFRPAASVKATAGPGPAAPPGSIAYSRGLVVAACVESMLGLAAAFLVAYLYTQLTTRTLLDFGPGIGITEADELLRKFLFVAFALLLAPHALTTYAAIGILLGRDTTRVARRYALIACWTVVGAALVAAWLATREGFVFDARTARYVYLFCGVSLAWHAVFVCTVSRLSVRR